MVRNVEIVASQLWNLPVCRVCFINIRFYAITPSLVHKDIIISELLTVSMKMRSCPEIEIFRYYESVSIELNGRILQIISTFDIIPDFNLVTVPGLNFEIISQCKILTSNRWLILLLWNYSRRHMCLLHQYELMISFC